MVKVSLDAMREPLSPERGALWSKLNELGFGPDKAPSATLLARLVASLGFPSGEALVEAYEKLVADNLMAPLAPPTPPASPPRRSRP